VTDARRPAVEGATRVPPVRLEEVDCEIVGFAHQAAPAACPAAPSTWPVTARPLCVFIPSTPGQSCVQPCATSSHASEPANGRLLPFTSACSPIHAHACGLLCGSEARCSPGVSNIWTGVTPHRPHPAAAGDTWRHVENVYKVGLNRNRREEHQVGLTECTTCWLQSLVAGRGAGP
jgi:hypothetical protein